MILAYNFLSCAISMSDFGIRMMLVLGNEFGNVPSAIF